jgi:hypothetical protein
MNTNTVQLTLDEHTGLYVHDTADYLRFESSIPCLIEYEITDKLLSSFLGYTVVISEENNIALTCSHSENYNGKKFKIVYKDSAIAELFFNQDIVYYI